jgi:flavin-dependent dehydrogenase
MLARCGISVCLVGLPPTRCNKIFFGETVSPNIKFVLSYLGLWKEFLDDEHLPSAGNLSNWGDEKIKENNFIFHPNSNGWHLDRSKFDSMLLNAAKAQGVSYFNSKVESIQNFRSRTTINLKNQNKSMIPDFIHSDFVIDATGRKSWYSRSRGVRKNIFDNLCGYICFFSSPENDSDLDSMTLIESVSNGWWYSALLPKNIRVVSFFTNSNLADAKYMKTFSGWRKAMTQNTHHVRLSIDKYNYRRTSGPHIMMSNSSMLERVVGGNWLAVGDAAATYDPLSSRGIFTAINNGIKASDITIKYLNGKGRCLGDYNNSVIIDYNRYLRQRLHYYKLENRWSNSPFWKQNQNYHN